MEGKPLSTKGCMFMCLYLKQVQKGNKARCNIKGLRGKENKEGPVNQVFRTMRQQMTHSDDDVSREVHRTGYLNVHNLFLPFCAPHRNPDSS